jgi:hypothetical protein
MQFFGVAHLNSAFCKINNKVLVNGTKTLEGHIKVIIIFLIG